jgi:hypothetical protein
MSKAHSNASIGPLPGMSNYPAPNSYCREAESGGTPRSSIACQESSDMFQAYPYIQLQA